jgi:ankyrin repeat protein
VQALIAAGADVNKASNDGRTPMYWASQEGHLEVASVLEAAAVLIPALPD